MDVDHAIGRICLRYFHLDKDRKDCVKSMRVECEVDDGHQDQIHPEASLRTRGIPPTQDSHLYLRTLVMTLCHLYPNENGRAGNSNQDYENYQSTSPLRAPVHHAESAIPVCVPQVRLTDAVIETSRHGDHRPSPLHEVLSNSGPDKVEDINGS